MSRSYEREKLGNAVHALARGTGTIQTRLGHAFIGMHTLMLEPLADENRQAELKAIFDVLTAGAGSVEEHAATFSTETASALAARISDLYSAICHDRIYFLQEKLEDAGIEVPFD